MKAAREMNPLGRQAELVVARILLGNGYAVIPAKDYTDPVGGAPLVHLETDLAAAGTDIVAIGSDAKTLFLEVKAKTRPGYMRTWRMHTHGVDLLSHRDYERIRTKTRCEVYLVVAEGPHEVNDQEGALLIAHLDKTRQAGRPAVNWPRAGGAGSRGSKGGWCWPRHIMDVLDPARIAPPTATQMPLL